MKNPISLMISQKLSPSLSLLPVNSQTFHQLNTGSDLSFIHYVDGEPWGHEPIEWTLDEMNQEDIDTGNVPPLDEIPEPMRQITETRYQLIQQRIERLKAKFPEAEYELYELSGLLWAFAEEVVA